MKNFSTAALIVAFASACSLLAAPNAQAATSSPSCAFLENAPDSHLVVRGDTLWGISAKFLAHPWCWPQVWGMNREQIRNPHWIYPGQVVYLDRANGRLRLGTAPGGNGRSQESGTVRLSPQVRIEGLGNEAIPAIPSGDIEPFLSQPLIVEEKELADSPRIVATQEGRVSLGKNDKAYVAGDLKDGTSFQVFRPGSPLKDPTTQAIIGYEAVYLGTLKLQRKGKTSDEAHTFIVATSKQEMAVGDRLVPAPPTPLLNYVPHPPQQPIEARVVSIYNGVTQAGQNQVVTINRGNANGLDLGTVVELYHYRGTIVDRTDTKDTIKIPDEKYGSLFIFRVFKNISYGLIMQVSETVQVGDVVRSPE